VQGLETGWLFRSQDCEALAQALHTALSSAPDSLERMGQRGMSHIAAFSKEALQIRTLGVYDKLLGTQLARSFRVLAGS
jgi:hypothetical protein